MIHMMGTRVPPVSGPNSQRTRRAPGKHLAYYRVLAGGALVLAVAMSACTSTSSGSDSAGLKGTPIKVMGIGGYTVSDPLAFLETDLQGAAAAVDRAGGIHGHPLQMLICDDSGDPNKNLACSRQAVADHVAAVITTDPDTVAGLPILEAAGIPDISTLGFWNQELTSRHVFIVNGGAPGEAADDAALLVKGAHARRIAIVYADQPDGLQAEQGAAAALKRLGITSVRGVPMNEHSTTDPTPVVIRSTEGGIQAVLLILAYDAADRYLRAAYRLHISHVTFGSDEDTFPPSVIKDLGAEANGTLIVASSIPLTMTSQPAVREFFRQMRPYPGFNLKNWTIPNIGVDNYTAVQLFAQVAKTVPTVTAQSMQAALSKAQNVPAGGMSAPLQFVHPVTGYPGATRIFNDRVLMMRIEGGKLVPLSGRVQWVRPLS
jgi:branched-chain amino acid transport system substrate-binding protein